jgi:HNH endonuclease
MRQGKTPKDSDGKPFEIHHKKPLSEGGTNSFENYEFTTQEEHRLGPNLKKNHPNLWRGRRR